MKRIVWGTYFPFSYWFLLATIMSTSRFVVSRSGRSAPALVDAWFIASQRRIPSRSSSSRRCETFSKISTFPQIQIRPFFSTTFPQIRPFFSTTQCWQEPPSSTDKENTEKSTPIPSFFSASDWLSSEFAIHLAISQEEAPIKAADVVAKALKKISMKEWYTEIDLLKLGSVWYLPAEHMGNDCKRPSRLAFEDADKDLKEGDYLRIHHNPRRFPAVDLYDWSVSETKRASSSKKNIIVDYNPSKGYVIVNKPSECVPVHPTVDNQLENVVSCLKEANPDDLDYVTMPQRLDQNTSGLVAVAISKNFSTYFSTLLRQKTASEAPEDGDKSTTIDPAKNYGVHKVYRCLVCLTPPQPTTSEAATTDVSTTTWSVDKALQELATLKKEEEVVRHFLEPDDRAPRRFLSTLPPDAKLVNSRNKTDKAGWAECLLKIKQVGNVCALRGNAASDELAQTLWNSTEEVMPPACQAVVELDIELLTGRTHQIRGQLSALGYPLVGDVPYGGADPFETSARQSHDYKGKLALQCSQLEFLDPDLQTVEHQKRGKRGGVFLRTDLVPSDRWNSYKLDEAWWTPALKKYESALKQTSEEDMTIMAALDIGLVDSSPRKAKSSSAAPVELNPDSLPPQAKLSPGRNKYVMVKAIDPNTGNIHKWFVKSASPQECGGPYHKDVSRDLVEWIEACGYKAVVTGGGRILYQPEDQRALVYGFSYGFDRGDHALAAKVIKEWSNNEMDTAYDDSNDVY